MKKEHKKKLIVPIIISIILIIVFIGYTGLYVFMNDLPIFNKIISCIISLALVGVVIYVLKQRINEVRSGEEDDLSKY